MTRGSLLRLLTARLPLTPGAVTLVAVDGVDGSGKTTFADAWARQLRRSGMPVARLRADRYLAPRQRRHARGRHDPDGFWLDSYDYEALRRYALDPLRPADPDVPPRYRPGVYDVRRERPVASRWHTLSAGERGAVALFDGLFLHRDELRGGWDFSVWLQVPFEVTFARMARRDGCSADPEHPSNARYLQGQQRYFAACAPWRRAGAVIDNTDPADPALI